ncbi:3-isopropylmalate dehydrogenase [Paenibacillus sp. J31TS4]|uniref:isocitrate/isopropylmalate dehydrogenase family protein n=1 Tax=Paenibacillus sp. J31TS4 TaxID=2807195 RepID=UPI001B08D541|nr:isocitrate/isopropylmalate dehydrogenase family protein [Paenibacillus sp. J31TS4]GIP39052.1 3-isopropylmalate dehydrogenase [Paenibacillus sp. J31TS4]
MANYRIGVLYGDGIGPEIVQATVDVMTAAASRIGGVVFDWVELPMGLTAIQEYGDPIPEETKQMLASCDGWIMGPHDSASYPVEHKEKRNPSGELRHHFDLYANIRPSKTMRGIRSVVNQADLVIFRENTEGFYADRNMFLGAGEFMPSPDTAISVGVFTKKAAERIAHAAFQMAMTRRKRVSIVHKANVIKLGYGLFLNTCYDISKHYPEVAVDDYHIDAMAAHLVRRAADFDVILTTNMFGDILSDLAGELVGSLGLSPSLNASEDKAMAQAAHGSAPDIAGQNKANPIGEMLSAVMLLDWLSTRFGDKRVGEVGKLVESSIQQLLEERLCTPDLGGRATTTEFTQALIQKIKD